MGTTGSKDEEPKTVVEQENSSGLHILELHMPTMGANIFVLLMLMLALAAAWRLRCVQNACSKKKKYVDPFCAYSPPPLVPPPLSPLSPYASLPPPSSHASPPPQPPAMGQGQQKEDLGHVLAAVAERLFERLEQPARLTYEEETSLPRRHGRRPRSPKYHDCVRFQELHDSDGDIKTTEEKCVETPRSFSCH